jgi:hypothetical protein
MPIDTAALLCKIAALCCAVLFCCWYLVEVSLRGRNEPVLSDSTWRLPLGTMMELVAKDTLVTRFNNAPSGCLSIWW